MGGEPELPEPELRQRRFLSTGRNTRRVRLCAREMSECVCSERRSVFLIPTTGAKCCRVME